MMKLFHTAGCHLCEQAWQLLEQANLSAQTVRCDIMNNEQWLTRYRASIPVLQDSQGRELCWPFDLASLKNWLNNS